MSSDLHSLYITVPMFIYIYMYMYMKKCINVLIENEWHHFKIQNILKILNQKKTLLTLKREQEVTLCSSEI